MGKIINELKEDYLYYIVLCMVIAGTSILNWDSNLMEGILPYYLTFSNYFSNGLNYYEVIDNNVYTWPMWGYGLVLLLKFKVIIIVIQQIFSLLTIIVIRVFLKNRIDNKSFKLVSLIILFALPWFFFQVSLWPYGISANLLTISLILFSEGVEKIKLNYIIVSAIFFGIMLNLRSDYFYFSFLISLAVIFLIIIKKYSSKVILFVFYWFFIIIITLTPWAIHSYKYSNNFSFVSSNSGHVFYISLGQLPNNIWKITPSDEDSSMRKYIDSNISTKESTLTAKSNELLKTRFFELVKNDPKEFLEKCFFNLKSFIIYPFYLGPDYFENKNDFKTEIKREIVDNNFYSAFKLIYNEIGFYIIFPLLSYLIGLTILIFTVVSSFIYFKKTKKLLDFDMLNFVITLVLLYQLALSVFAYHLPIYSTNIFLLLIVLIGININKKSSLIIIEK